MLAHAGTTCCPRWSRARYCDGVSPTISRKRELKDPAPDGRAAVETAGGQVEKFVGDAVLAAFGVPVLREDDAERAVVAGLAPVGARPPGTAASRS